MKQGSREKLIFKNIMSPTLVTIISIVLLLIAHTPSSEAQQQSSQIALQRVIGQILAQLNSTAGHLRAGRAQIRPSNTSSMITPHTSEEEGKLRLVGGKTLFEGNVEIMHQGLWGSICDDLWELAEANVVCRQMGYVLGALRATTGSRYGQAKKPIWMGGLSCIGFEDALQDCPGFPKWRNSDCRVDEAAGVVCRIQWDQKLTRTPKLQTTPRSDESSTLTTPSPSFNKTFSLTTTPRTIRLKPVRLTRRRRLRSGQQARNRTRRTRPVTTATTTTTTETPETSLPPPTPEIIITTTTASQIDLPDLVPDAVALEESAFIEDRSVLFLQCAMEENCLSKSAYELDRSDPNWIFNSRRLLRFTAAIHNIGRVDFRPHTPKSDWIWHSCHRHYHSMEVFAHFDLFDLNSGERVAEGHKASFCLEDNLCKEDSTKRFVCANYGDQGISVGCVDIYKYDLDCQWIDITDISPGAYRLQVRINPEQKVPEISFDNNAASCHFLYTPIGGLVSNCTLG